MPLSLKQNYRLRSVNQNQYTTPNEKSLGQIRKYATFSQFYHRFLLIFSVFFIPLPLKFKKTKYNGQNKFALRDLQIRFS